MKDHVTLKEYDYAVLAQIDALKDESILSGDIMRNLMIAMYGAIFAKRVRKNLFGEEENKED